MKLFQKTTKQRVQSDSAPETAPKPQRKQRRERDREGEKRYAFFRTRRFYGLVAILAGLLLSLLGIPALNVRLNETVSVLIFDTDVSAGTLLTAELLTTVERSAYNLPSGTIGDAASVLGQYLCVDALAGDCVTAARLSSVYPGDDPQLATLPEGKVALSLSLPGLAQNVSGKLRSGDVIQLYAVESSGESGTAQTPPELQAVEVLAVTYSDGNDLVDGAAEEGSILAAVTVLLDPRQAVVLVGLEESSTLYAALVCRGDEVRRAELLEEQMETLNLLERNAEQAEWESLEVSE